MRAFSGLISPYHLYQLSSYPSHPTPFHADRPVSLSFLEPCMQAPTSGPLHRTPPPYIFRVHSFTPFKSLFRYPPAQRGFPEHIISITLSILCPSLIFSPSIHHLLTYNLIIYFISCQPSHAPPQLQCKLHEVRAFPALFTMVSWGPRTVPDTQWAFRKCSLTD